MRQYADPTPAATAAWKWDTPRRRSCAYRVRPFFHCRQIYMRNRRRIQASRLCSTIGVWHRDSASKLCRNCLSDHKVGCAFQGIVGIEDQVDLRLTPLLDHHRMLQEVT